MLKICIASVAAGALGLSSLHPLAQTVADPVITAFREYRAAQEHNDLEGAEAAAKRALSASEARDGDGGVTAVLAMNLALAEMDLGRKQDAIAPAQKALELANGGAKGVDSFTLRLLLGEAELSKTPTGDEHDLINALRSADGRKDLDSYIYPAAVVLSAAAQHMKHYEVALEAARAAEKHAAGAGFEIPLAKGRALITQGVALASMHQDEDAQKALVHAIDLLAPLAPESADDSETLGELSYAQALAVQGAVSARQASERNQPHEDQKPLEPAELKGKPPLCPGTLIPTPLPQYPNDMLAEYSVGSAVLRASIGARGEVLSIRPLVIFPESSFRKSVADPKIKWKFQMGKPTPGCRMETTDKIITVRFAIG